MYRIQMKVVKIEQLEEANYRTVTLASRNGYYDEETLFELTIPCEDFDKFTMGAMYSTTINEIIIK